MIHLKTICQGSYTHHASEISIKEEWYEMKDLILQLINVTMSYYRTLSHLSLVHCWIFSGVHRSELMRMEDPDPAPSFLVAEVLSCSFCLIKLLVANLCTLNGHPAQ